VVPVESSAEPFLADQELTLASPAFSLESIHYTTKRNPHGGPYPMKIFQCSDVEELAAKVDAGGW
jgi:hypothetical protein